MREDWTARIVQLAANRESGASAIHNAVLELLTQALAERIPLRPLGRQLVAAQPSMAPIWTAVGHALAAERDPAVFARYVQQVRRAPRSLARVAAPVLRPNPGQPLRIVTISFSGTVVQTIESLLPEMSVEVACSEGQPAGEGRRLAERLAARGIGVDYYVDAALGHALAGADCVLVGADAVAPGWFLNKSGTRMLAAAAVQQGIPVHVLATRDKFVSEAIGARLVIGEGAAAEVWASPPAGVTVHNPYFERVPLDAVASVLSDVGALAAAVVADACPTAHDGLLLDL